MKNREYNDGYSYEALVNSDKGYSSFKSIRTGEDLYLHYSIIEDFNWGIMLARYETQVFEETHKMARNLVVIFAIIILIIAVYLEQILKSEKNKYWTNFVCNCTLFDARNIIDADVSYVCYINEKRYRIHHKFLGNCVASKVG